MAYVTSLRAAESKPSLFACYGYCMPLLRLIWATMDHFICSVWSTIWWTLVFSVALSAVIMLQPDLRKQVLEFGAVGGVMAWYYLRKVVATSIFCFLLIFICPVLAFQFWISPAADVVTVVTKPHCRPGMILKTLHYKTNGPLLILENRVAPPTQTR